MANASLTNLVVFDDISLGYGPTILHLDRANGLLWLGHSCVSRYTWPQGPDAYRGVCALGDLHNDGAASALSLRFSDHAPTLDWMDHRRVRDRGKKSKGFCFVDESTAGDTVVVMGASDIRHSAKCR